MRSVAILTLDIIEPFHRLCKIVTQMRKGRVTEVETLTQSCTAKARNLLRALPATSTELFRSTGLNGCDNGWLQRPGW